MNTHALVRRYRLPSLPISQNNAALGISIGIGVPLPGKTRSESNALFMALPFIFLYLVLTCELKKTTSLWKTTEGSVGGKTRTKPR